jgi:integrase
MPKLVKNLSALEIKRLKDSGTYAVGHVAGLQLVISDNGTRQWVYRTMTGLKRSKIGVGGNSTTLAEAIAKAKEHKESISKGGNPVKDKKDAKDALKLKQSQNKTFKEYAQEHMSTRYWGNEKHGKQWHSTLATYVYPKIGNRSIDSLTVNDIYETIKPIWHTKTETASRTLGRVKTIIDSAIVRGYRDRNKGNPAVWSGTQSTLLTAPKDIIKVKHFEFVPPDEMYLFMQHLKRIDTVSTKALQLLTLIPVRSGSLRLATWQQFDFEKRIWTIPPENMKNGKEFVTPLSSYAINLLKSLPRVAGTDLVFSGTKLQPLSDNTLSKMMREMVAQVLISKGVPHGLRSSFQVFRRDFSNFSDEIGDVALSHTVGNQVSNGFSRRMG